ncbi:MAG: hypothetical protein M3Y13_04575, partial [Armatimonadota bacterium]|nr:hypothetical protein [Armatimonadota bacterium]
MKFPLLVVAFVFLCLPVQGSALTVRVDASQGAPRLVVNGRPVRARMFFGIYRASQPVPVTIPSGAHMIRFEFTAIETEAGGATMHFRFGQSPGDVFLDNIHVTDLDTRRETLPTCTFEGGQSDFMRDWQVWPPRLANMVGTVTVEAGVGEGGSAG